MSDQFTEDDIRLASFRLATENNAMLRIMLANQEKIMAALNILNLVVPKSAFADLVPGTPEDNEMVQYYLKYAENIANQVQKRAWEWVQMNSNISDNENNEEE